MKFRTRYILPLVGLLLLAGAATAQQSTKRSEGEDATARGLQGRVIVKLDERAFSAGPSTALFGETARRYGISRITPWLPPGLVTYRLPFSKTSGISSPILSLLRIMVVEYSAVESPEEIASALSRLGGVEYAEPVYERKLFFTPNDPSLGLQWYMDVLGMPDAWEIARADTNLIIAVTDAGIDRTHPDLEDGIWYNPGENGTDNDGKEKSTNGKDDDANGLVDDFWGYDFAGADGNSQDADPSPGASSHGTHVAGIAAASGDNGIGIAGVAFGARIMSVKVADDDADPSIYSGAQGILYAAKMGAQVINCSWGSTGFSRADLEVIGVVNSFYGSLIVAAAGNDGDTRFRYPAAYPGVISVSSVNSMGNHAYKANYNYRVDLAGTGEGIYSTVPGGTYAYLSGTSMATPTVSGAALLLMSKYPQLTAAKVREILRATTDDLSPTVGAEFETMMGTGRLNVFRALQQAESVSSARLLSYRIIEPGGDNIIDPGETVTLVAEIGNMLAPSNVTATLVPVSHPGDMTVSSPTVDLGPMAGGQKDTTEAPSFTFTIPTFFLPNTEVTFKVRITTASRTNDEYVTLRVQPTFLTTNLNRIATTFNSVGNIGYNGINRRQGDGFTYGASKNYLFHSGLMVGTDSAHLSDVVRIGPSSMGTNDGFRLLERYQLTVNGDSSVQTGRARFSDMHRAIDERVGVDIAMKTWETRDPAYDNILLVEYDIKNVSGAPIHDMHCGLYFDWDIGLDGEGDKVTYDAESRMGFAWNTVSENRPYIGVGLLTGQEIDFYAIDNNDPDIAPSSNFTMANKWRVLSSGIGRASSSIGDVSMLMGGKVLSLAPEQSTKVTFAIVGSPDFGALRTSVNRANDLYALVSGVELDPELSGSGETAVVHPNPFTNRARVRFSMPAPGDVSFELYTLQGELVASTSANDLASGPQEVVFDAATLPAGIYFYELRLPDGKTARGKVVKQ